MSDKPAKHRWSVAGPGLTSRCWPRALPQTCNGCDPTSVLQWLGGWQIHKRRRPLQKRLGATTISERNDRRGY